MVDILRIKRRLTGGAAGAPAALANAELAYNEVDDKLYYGKGNSAGQATSIIPIAGPGHFAPLASPVFTGAPSLPTGTTGVTQTAGNNTTALATTAFVTAADALKANLASPVFTGDPQAPTPATADNDTSIATTAYVKAQGYVTGGPYLPTAGGTLSGGLIMSGGSNGINYSTLGVDGNHYFGFTWASGGILKAYVDTSFVGNVTFGGPYLPIAGGTLSGMLITSASGISNSGPLYQNNNVPIYANDTGGTARYLIGMGADNNLYINDGTARGTIIQGPVYSTGTASGFILYDRGVPSQGWTMYSSASAYRIYSGAGAKDAITIDTNGNVLLPGQLNCVGRNCRTGVGGASTSNLFNVNWTGLAQLWIDSTNVGNITLTCDYRVKENITDLPSTWDRVKALRPISYTVKENEELLVSRADPMEWWGFLAHELQDTLTESAATGYKDAPNVMQSPNLMVLVAPLTKALQEAMARIEELEARLDALPPLGPPILEPRPA